jgi:hypothetical protein
MSTFSWGVIFILNIYTFYMISSQTSKIEREAEHEAAETLLTRTNAREEVIPYIILE